MYVQKECSQEPQSDAGWTILVSTPDTTRFNEL
jgi:hypothetical protein